MDTIKQDNSDTNPSSARTGAFSIIAELNRIKPRLSFLSKDNSLFIIPTGKRGIGNDAEMNRILQILKMKQIPFYPTPQVWGASFAQDQNLAVVIECAQRRGKVVCAVELSGSVPPNVLLIDHHNDKVARGSSLLQVLQLLEISPERVDHIIAANDTGWIPGMRAMGATEKEVWAIRALEWKTQGVTRDEVRQALSAVRQATVCGKTLVVTSPHAQTGLIGDMVFKKHNTRDLLIKSETGMAVYFGPKPLEVAAAAGCIVEQREHGYAFAGGWCGGRLPEEGFVGLYYTSEQIESIKRFLASRH